ADFDGALTTMSNESGDSSEQCWAAGDCLSMMFPVIEAHVEVPPVVDERNEVRHQIAGRQFLRGKAIPTPLVFKLIVDILGVGSFSVKPSKRNGGIGFRIKGGDQYRDSASPRG